MKNNTEKETQGILKYLEQIYNEGVFQKSELHINEGDSTKLQEFYGYVPESILGKKVFLFQKREEENLFQRLTIKEEDNTYQIRATSRKFAYQK